MNSQALWNFFFWFYLFLNLCQYTVAMKLPSEYAQIVGLVLIVCLQLLFHNVQAGLGETKECFISRLNSLRLVTHSN